MRRALKKHERAIYPSDIENVALARQRIAQFARTCGFTDDQISDIRLAAGEAMSNAVEHGGEKPGRSFVVDCSFSNDALTIEIQDSGRTFIEPSHGNGAGPDDRGRGFGIFLMRRLMDEVSFAHEGRIVRLVRRLA